MTPNTKPDCDAGSLSTDDPLDRLKNERDFIAQSSALKSTRSAMDWAVAEIERFRSTAVKGEPVAKSPSDKELWEAGCLTRTQLASWTDDDLASHAAGLRKTIRFLVDRLDASPPQAETAGREALAYAIAECAEDRPSAGTIKTFEKWADKLLSKFALAAPVEEVRAAWRTDFENAPSPCIGWCVFLTGDEARQIWHWPGTTDRWSSHGMQQTVKAWQPLPVLKSNLFPVEDVLKLPDALTPPAIDELFARDDLYTARAVFSRLKNFGYSLVKKAPIEDVRAAVIEECAKIARAHDGAARKEREAKGKGYLHEDDRDAILAEERGENIASRIIERKIRALNSHPSTGKDGEGKS